MAHEPLQISYFTSPPQVNGLPGASDYLYSRLRPSDAAYFLVLKLDRVGGRMGELSGKDICSFKSCFPKSQIITIDLGSMIAYG